MAWLIDRFIFVEQAGGLHPERARKYFSKS